MSTDKLVELDPVTVRGMVQRGEAVLIDVREPAEYSLERIRGALLFPLATFDPAALPSGGKVIVLHCGTGRRSAMAAQKMLAAGAAEARHMKGGLAAWKQSGLPVLAVNPATGALESRE